MNNIFKLKAPFKPSGSQPEAIRRLLTSKRSVLLGVTGSGKTFTIANVIARQNKPVIVLAPNKTLAAQLYEEFSLFFPENKVCYFVSYYDYYQPESYLPAQDIYIPKETKINSEIERLRIEATASLINRRDTIIVASVSCIYSIGNPLDYQNMTLLLEKGQRLSRKNLIEKLILIQYNRNEIEKDAGTFQVLGNTIEINLPYQKEKLRIEFFGNQIETLQWVEKLSNNVLKDIQNILICPAKHFVVTEEKKKSAIESIEIELKNRLNQLKNPIYKERLKTKVNYDLEMLREIGYCSGIENYSIHFDGRMPGQAPYCLFDFIQEDFLLIIDESHISIPQLKGMYIGDKSRKKNLIEFGFRLPSAFDNRPLKFKEVEKYFKNIIFVSATPGDYEIKNSEKVIEQIIRPTGLLDPKIKIHPRKNQLESLLNQIKKTNKKGFRTLITVLTKKLAEELAEYLEEKKIKSCYLHSSIKTNKRSEILQKLRLGIFDCLVGVNLLREGLDLPEVALVAIMDADVESFLRDKRSLIQIIGRAARNTESQVIFYSDKITKSMKNAIEETNRRRKIQENYNKKNNIKPTTVTRKVKKNVIQLSKNKQSKIENIKELEIQMHQAAEELNFEKAIKLREEWIKLKSNKEKS